ncbi:unnamed protein product [Ilex paraguariensis]|uniref:Phototropic-responsive NPH3 family protein n=1 Tax=Ilex paraguariensis TaxID=185542 RepID=A0ABC8T2M6_9AQUA
MEDCCNLEVDVNGQETFLVDKKILASFSCRLNKLFEKSRGATKNLKVIFHDFPGGAEGFELIATFCYNNGRIDITPSNIFLLHCAANFMEMNVDSRGKLSLSRQIKKYFEGIHFWTWSKFVVGLKQCQDLFLVMNSSHMLQEFLDCLVGRLVLPYDASPYTSSSDRSSFQFSGDISLDSMRNYSSQTLWWFEDLVFLDTDLFEKVIGTMLSHKFNHTTLSSFIFYYRKSRFVGASILERCKITETVISLLCLLDESSISCRGLFETFRVDLNLKISKCCKIKLESLIGPQLDQATLDDLLVPPPPWKKYAYDVNLILRLLKVFLLDSSKIFSQNQLKKIAGLMDLYMAEVAPDRCLKLSKFVALAMALPDSARDSHDGVYRAMDMYLEVHNGLCEEEKIRLCCALNYDKLSPGTLGQLAQNTKFPPIAVVTAIVSQQSKLKKLPKDANHLKTFSDWPVCSNKKGIGAKKVSEQIFLRAKNYDFPSHCEKLRLQMQGIPWKVVKLEEVCKT